MKKKEFNQLKTSDKATLVGAIDAKKVELAKVQVDMAGGKESNLKRAKLLKLEIAKISTIIREMDMASEHIGEKQS
jgi:ribosomal protein L29